MLNINLIMEQIPLETYVDINEIMSKTVWTHSLKRIRLSRNVICNVVKYCRVHVHVDAKGMPTNRRTGNGGFYYALIMEIARTEELEGYPYPRGLPCYDCREMIAEGETCISGSKSNGKKYLHPMCAHRRNII